MKIDVFVFVSLHHEGLIAVVPEQERYLLYWLLIDTRLVNPVDLIFFWYRPH